MGKRKKAVAPTFNPIKAKHYAERVKALMLERKALNEDISEVCAEAKDDGLEPTFIRFAAGEALKDEAERNARDEKRSLYLHALGLAVHAVESGEMSARQAAKIYKIGKSSVYKELSVREVSTDTPPKAAALPAHDPSTGEILGTVVSQAPASSESASLRGGPSTPASLCGAGEVVGAAETTASPAAKASEAESHKGPLTSTDLAGSAGGVDAPAPIPESCGGEFTGPDTKPVALATSPSAGVAPGPQDPIEVVPPPASSAGNAGGSHDERPLTPEPEVARAVPPATDPDKDDLAIPDFLDARKRRQPEAVA